MITNQDLIERIQKNVGVPWQSQRSDGLSDGLQLGSANAKVTGIITTFAPSLNVLKQAVASGKTTIICREGPFYSRGERAPIGWRNAPAPPKELIDADTVCRAKQEFITEHNISVIRFFDNWDARETDGQLRGLADALAWHQFHVAERHGGDEYDPQNVYFMVPETSLASLARNIKHTLKLQALRVIGDAPSRVRKAALFHGLLLVADAERILSEPDVDVVVAGDAVEWEAVPYFQDLVTAGKAKGLILIGQEASEEPGMRVMAGWLRGFISEIPIEWIPAGEPFWTLT